MPLAKAPDAFLQDPNEPHTAIWLAFDRGGERILAAQDRDRVIEIFKRRLGTPEGVMAVPFFPRPAKNGIKVR